MSFYKENLHLNYNYSLFMLRLLSSFSPSADFRLTAAALCWRVAVRDSRPAPEDFAVYVVRRNGIRLRIRRVATARADDLMLSLIIGRLRDDRLFG